MPSGPKGEAERNDAAPERGKELLPSILSVLKGVGATRVIDETPVLRRMRELWGTHSECYVVRGRVSGAGDLSTVAVAAFDRDLRPPDEQLGSTRVDASGRYEIFYRRSQFQRAEKGAADLVVRAFGPNGELLGESETLFNAPAAAVVDLTLPSVPTRPRPSEYERLLTELAPTLQDVAPAALTEEDVLFVAGDTGVDRSVVQLLAKAARLAQEVDLPTEVFYALARAGQLVDLDHVLARSPDEVRSILRQAMETSVIPSLTEEALEGLMRRFEQLRVERGLWESHRVVGQLVHALSGAPLPNLTVHAFDLDSGDSPRELGRDVTSDQGFFVVSYTAPLQTAQPRPGGDGRRLRLSVLTAPGEKLHEVDVRAVEGQVVEVRVPVPPTEPEALALAELAGTLSLNLPPELWPALDEHGVRTLADVRRVGGLSALEGLPIDADHPGLRTLEAHASLSMVSPDAELNNNLIEQGFTSVAAVAAAPRTEFVKAAHERLGDFKAAELHRAAHAQTRFLDEVLAGVRAYPANGSLNFPGLDFPGLDELFPVKCGCRDCEAAVSPLAYLADLLAYAVRNLKESDGARVSAESLAQTFHQPFDELPASCESAERQVRQVRLCLEVLRRYLETRALPAAGSPSATTLAEAERSYRLAAYTTLLNHLGTTFDEIRLARSATPDSRSALADRLGLDLTEPRGSGDELDRLFLDPDEPDPTSLDALTERNLEALFGLVQTRDALVAGPGEAELLRWRRRHLRAVWTEQDRPTDAYSSAQRPILPLIDPDLIGPDDFRRPESGDPAFALWLKRRRLVDKALDDLREEREREPKERGLRRILERVFGTSPDLDGLRDRVSGGSKKDVETANKEITALGLTVESFTRLLEVADKDRLTHDEVGEDEWTEVYSILAQAQKVRLFPKWRKEERDQGIVLGPESFWIALREPSEGRWPPAPSSRPLVDPETVKLTDLPEPTAGKRAIEFHRRRGQRLDEIRKGLQVKHETEGFDAMLADALGTPPAGRTWPQVLGALRDDLNSTNEAVAAAARSRIENELHMRTEAFDRLMTVRAKPSPTGAERADVYATLTSARKARTEFPNWALEEQDTSTGIVYWTALKAKLPRWRATAEARAVWQQALRARGQAPIVDPDLIGPGDLKNPVPGDGAFDLWKERDGWVKGLLDNLAAQRGAATSPAAGLNRIVSVALGIPSEDLWAMVEARERGEGIQARLDQLSLTTAGFNRLVRVRELASSPTPAPVLKGEWSDVDAILAQAQKRRVFARWQATEAERRITLSPDLFQIPAVDPSEFPPPPPPALPPWLATREDRLDWQERLQTRIDQDSALGEALRTAVSETEETTLPALRDALIMATDATGDPLALKAKRMADRLLIDTKASGCQKTTRVAQAIETLQMLLFSARTRQLHGTEVKLELQAEHFDEEWKWIGSYATWRAAMFVFLYPENILIPTLRRHQTPGFRSLVQELRSNRRLTPDQACRSYNSYQAYLEDVRNLTLETSCQTRTRVYQSDGCQKTPTSQDRSLFYMFGRSRVTNKVYWSAYDPVGPWGCNQTFWDEIPTLVGTNVTSIVGAVPYAPQANQRYIFLFVIKQEKGQEQLIFLKYDLEALRWDGEEPTELELPPGCIPSSTIIVQRRFENWPPSLVLYGRGGLYERALNVEGDGWQEAKSSSESESEDEWTTFASRRPDDIFWSAVTVGWELRAVLESPGPFGQVWDVYSIKDVIIRVVARNKAFRGVRSLAGYNIFKPIEPASYIGTFLTGTGVPYVFSKLYGNVRAKRLDTWDDSGVEARPMRVIPSCGDAGSPLEMAAYDAGPVFSSEDDYYRALFRSSSGELLSWMRERAVPKGVEAFEIIEANPPLSNLTYSNENTYFVPIYIALQLQVAGQFTAALDWFRKVYDYSVPEKVRRIGGRLETSEASAAYNRGEDWLQDPLNPHSIAAMRRNTYTRFTILALVRCLLEFADEEFTRDTAESVARARRLYLTALELLDSEDLRQHHLGCEDVIGRLKIPLGDPRWQPARAAVARDLEQFTDLAVLEPLVAEIEHVLSGDGPIENRFAAAHRLIADTRAARPKPPALAATVERSLPTKARTDAILLANPDVANATVRVGKAVARDFENSVAAVSGLSPARLREAQLDLPWLREPVTPVTRDGSGPRLMNVRPQDSAALLPHEVEAHSAYKPMYLPGPVMDFCIPPNPVLRALRLRAELNLHKLRNCRNIAGMERELEAYAAPTDTTSGLPMIGAGGQPVLPGTAALRPTPYRYGTLIERAKQLVGLAQQIEAAMLSALERRDAEAYSLLEARQDEQLTRGRVRLQDLRIREARSDVTLAELQQQRAQYQADHYQQLLDEGLLTTEALAYAFQALAVVHFHAAAGVKQGFTMGFGGLGEIGTAMAATSSFFQMQAAFERRRQDWEFQRNLARHDVRIGAQRVTVAQDHVRVVGQERLIAEMEADHAAATIEFLSSKFTNFELYDWMSDVLGGAYSFFLQQATAVAKLAENQLAFERQEIPVPFIQADYWRPPDESAFGGSGEEGGPDRRGLTGSARLLQDIYRLDQDAFETNKRKLQLVKTISLAQLAPAEFQRFRETGVMNFATPLEMFDRDFPGHYLRLIHRVRTSVIALIPPNQGIRATLSTTGRSRVAIGGVVFQTVAVSAGPQSVALSSSRDATGLFELDTQPEMLLPFEGIGVDTQWEFRMPKAANPFDYRTIADLVITFEYTALNSFDYRQQVIQAMRPTISAERPFSFRHQLADQWYDLHNPDQTATPMHVRFRTTREDFPPNLDALKIQHVVLYCARAGGETFEIPVKILRFSENGGGPVGGAAVSVDGVISTRRGNAGSWAAMQGRNPVGEWELAFPDTEEIRNRFKNEQIEDILLVVIYSGRTPEYKL